MTTCEPFYGFGIHRAHDLYVVPHIVNVLWVGVIARDPWLAFTLAGLNEAVETLAQTVFQSFVIFIGANDDVENLTASLVEDWLIQGGIGALLALLCIAIYMPPRLLRLRDLRERHVGRFFWYLLVVAGLPVIVGSALYRLTIAGFEAGPLIYTASLWLAILLIPVRATEALVTIGVFSTVINLQQYASYLPSTGIQSWLWSLVFVIYLGLRVCLVGRTAGQWDPFEPPSRTTAEALVPGHR
jgi:hypothetical protein